MADNTIAQAYVQIIPSAKGMSGSIQNAIAPEASRAGVAAGNNISGSLSGRLKTVGAALAKSGALITAISVPLIAGINKALSAYQTQLEAETKLTEIYKTRMGASKEAAQATMDYASALQKIGVVGDEVTLSGAQQLATFAKYPETVETLLPAMDNLLVQQHGLNATTADAVSVANLMGKAMNGNAGALRRVGITFDEDQEKILKYGNEMERAAVLNEVITQNVGYMNEEMAKTPLGKIQQMKNSLADVKEQLGAQLAPVVASLAQWVPEKVVPALEKVMAFMSQHPIIAKIVVGLTAVLAILGPILTMTGMLVMSIGALIPVVTAVGAPVYAVVAAVVAVIAVLVYAYNHSEKFRALCQKIAAFLMETFRKAIELTKTKFQAFVSTMKNVVTWVGNAWAKIKDFGAGVYAKIAGPIIKAYNKIKEIVDKIKAFFPISIGKIFTNIKLPEFKMTNGDFNNGKAPRITTIWHAKAEEQPYLFKGATLFGAGEKNDEMLYGRKALLRDIASVAGGDEITINVYGAEGQSVTAIAEAVEKRLIASQNRRRMAWA